MTRSAPYLPIDYQLSAIDLSQIIDIYIAPDDMPGHGRWWTAFRALTAQAQSICYAVGDRKKHENRERKNQKKIREGF